jgi:Arc/MetJ-type ribon-helix-helix transcriptional regulator
MERTQISLTEEQADRLRRLARRRRSSMAALIREAVDRVYPGSRQRDADWDRALAAVGGFRSDRSEVSERHDDYLADAFGE